MPAKIKEEDLGITEPVTYFSHKAGYTAILKGRIKHVINGEVVTEPAIVANFQAGRFTTSDPTTIKLMRQLINRGVKKFVEQPNARRMSEARKVAQRVKKAQDEAAEKVVKEMGVPNTTIEEHNDFKKFLESRKIGPAPIVTGTRDVHR